MENTCHRHQCEVAFADTDASGWVRFSKILIYAEKAEHEFMRLRGLDVFNRATGGWPRFKIMVKGNESGTVACLTEAEKNLLQADA